MRACLVTGADGFVGQHLVAELLARGDRVLGAVRSLPPTLTTLPADLATAVEWIEFDLERPAIVRELVARRPPVDAIFHLAALSSVAKSLQDAEPVFRINVIGTLFLLQEILRRTADAAARPRILISGSGDVYGAAAGRHRPLTEDCPIEPLNPYAVSKAAQELLALQFGRAHDLPVIVTRGFNHTGPGQRPPYVAADFAVQALRARAAGSGGVIHVGNLDVRRDFTDVRDVVRAYRMLVDDGEPGTVYNVCSGRSFAIRDLLEILQEITRVRLDVRVDPDRQRAVDVGEALGSFERLNRATGWEPRIDLHRSLGDLVVSLEAAAPA